MLSEQSEHLPRLRLATRPLWGLSAHSSPIRGAGRTGPADVMGLDWREIGPMRGAELLRQFKSWRQVDT